MPIFEYQELKIEVDEDGFIQKPEEWNEEVAKALPCYQLTCRTSG